MGVGARIDSSPVSSRLRRLFERQVLRVSPTEKKEEVPSEPSTMRLDSMVRSFLEDDGAGGEGEKGAASRCCNCFSGGDASDDEAASDIADTIKGLVQCATLRERNLLADVSVLVERHRAAGARKGDLLRLLAESLRAAGRDAAVCLSLWTKCSSHLGGAHEYVDVLLPAASDRGEPERVFVDVGFRTAFEVARPTKAYRAVLQRLPSVFVGKEDRLRLLVAAAADAVRASMKKRGLYLPPWRKLEYMRAKWLSSFDREIPTPPPPPPPATEAATSELAGEDTPPPPSPASEAATSDLAGDAE